MENWVWVIVWNCWGNGCYVLRLELDCEGYSIGDDWWWEGMEMFRSLMEFGRLSGCVFLLLEFNSSFLLLIVVWLVGIGNR